MSSLVGQERQQRGAPGDRLFDENEERLRDAAAHLIDFVRALVRRRLAEGRHPEEALSDGLAMLEHWMEARGAIGFAPNETAERITALIRRLLRVLRAKHVLLFHIEAQDELGGLTPIQAYAQHRIWSVEQLVTQIELQVARAELDRERGAAE